MGIPAPQGVDASGTPPAGDQANAVVTGSFAAVGPGQSFAFRGPMNLVLWAAISTTISVNSQIKTSTVASATGLANGQAINSSAVPPGSTIGNLSGTTITLALPTQTYPAFSSTSSPQLTGLPVTTGLLGAAVSGPGIPSGTTVLAIVRAAVAPTGVSLGTTGIILLAATPTSALPTNTAQFFDFAPAGPVAAATNATAIFTGAAITFNGTVQLERSFDGGSTWLCCNIGSSGALAQWTGSTVGPISLTFGEPEKNVLYRLNCTAFTSVTGSGTLNYRISQTGGAAESLAIGPLAGG